MKKLNLVIVLHIIINYYSFSKAEDLVVAIDSLVKIVNEKSECNFDSWAKNLENTCVCCIVKNAHQVFSGKKKASDLINECLKANKCNDESIKNLIADSKGKGLQGEDLYQQFIRHIYDKTVVVKNVSPSASLLDKLGNFTETSLKEFLLQAYQENKLRNQAFKAGECLKIKDMVIEKSEAPWGTAQLFLIESSCGSVGENSFILKEMKKPNGPEGEIYKLVKGATYNPLKSLIYPNKIAGLPQLVFPLAYLSYDFKGQKRQLSLMNTAAGKPLMAYMKLFANNPNDKNIIKAVSQSYFDTGASMANFYKKYMSADSKPGALPKSITQGDLHAGNVFYDITNRQIILIDNERISNSLEKPMDICSDIAFLLMKSLFVMKWVVKSVQNFPYKEWYELSVPSFIVGFLSTYPKTEVKNILQALEQCLINYKDPETGKNWYTDKEILPKNHQEYMAPIFKRLNDWISRPFIAANSDINAMDEGGKTILFDAAQKERLLMWPLIVAGANVDAKDKDNNTPLHDAAYFNKANAIKVLVDAGANINSQDKNGDTPLHKAVINNSKEAINMLIALGANKNIKNNKGIVADTKP